MMVASKATVRAVAMRGTIGVLVLGRDRVCVVHILISVCTVVVLVLICVVSTGCSAVVVTCSIAA